MTAKSSFASYIIVAGVYLLLGIIIFEVALLTDSLPTSMTILTAIFLISLIPITSILSQKTTPAHSFLHYGRLLPIISLFFSAYILRLLLLLTFGFPWEKAAVAYLVVLTVLLVAKSPLTDIGLTSHSAPSHAVVGLAVGTSYLALIYVAYYSVAPILGVKLSYEISLSVWGSIFSYAVFSLMTAFSEEGLFRGFILNTLAHRVGASGAIVWSSFLFGLWHTALPLAFYGNLILTLSGVAGLWYEIASHTIWGMVAGILYVRTRSLVGPITMHASWNVAVSAFTVLPTIQTVFDTAVFTLIAGLAGLVIYMVVERLIPSTSIR